MEGTLREDRYTFMTIPRSFLITMRNVSDKSCTENQNTHFVFSNFPPENRAVYEIMWKKYCTDWQAADDNKLRRIRIACWITQATNTHSEYVIFIAFSTATVGPCIHLNVVFIHTLYVLLALIFYNINTFVQRH